jgi:hypothetical protein
MTRPVRFALYASGVALVSVISIVMGVAAADGAVGWAAAGWAAAAIPGIVGGAALAATLGRPGVGFLIGLFGTMVFRALGLIAVLILARTVAGSALRDALVGFATGLVPLFVFEAAWFLKASRGGPVQP